MITFAIAMPIGTLIGIIVALLYVGVAVVIVLNHQESSSKLFWLFFFLVIPVIGFVVYVVAGYSYRSAGMRRRLHAGIRDVTYMFLVRPGIRRSDIHTGRPLPRCRSIHP